MLLFLSFCANDSRDRLHATYPGECRAFTASRRIRNGGLKSCRNDGNVLFVAGLWPRETIRVRAPRHPLSPGQMIPFHRDHRKIRRAAYSVLGAIQIEIGIGIGIDSRSAPEAEGALALTGADLDFDSDNDFEEPGSQPCHAHQRRSAALRGVGDGHVG